MRIGLKLCGISASVLAISGCAATTAEVNVAKQNKRLIEKGFSDFNAGRPGLFELMSPDLVWTIEGTGMAAGTFHSKQEFVDRAAQPLASRFKSRVKLTIRGIWADGDHVIARFDGDAVTRDGKAYHGPYLWILTIKEGRIVEGNAFFDHARYESVVKSVPPGPGHLPKADGGEQER